MSFNTFRDEEKCCETGVEIYLGIIFESLFSNKIF